MLCPRMNAGAWTVTASMRSRVSTEQRKAVRDVIKRLAYLRSDSYLQSDCASRVIYRSQVLVLNLINGRSGSHMTMNGDLLKIHVCRASAQIADQ